MKNFHQLPLSKKMVFKDVPETISMRLTQGQIGHTLGNGRHLNRDDWGVAVAVFPKSDE